MYIEDKPGTLPEPQDTLTPSPQTLAGSRLNPPKVRTYNKGKKLAVKKSKLGGANLKAKEVTDIVKRLVAKIDKKNLVAQVAEEANMSASDALDFILEHRVDKEIHNELVESITSGAIAATALAKLNEKVEKGDMEALKLVMGFSKSLMPNSTQAIKSLELHTHNTNVFQALDEAARKRLGEL